MNLKNHLNAALSKYKSRLNNKSLLFAFIIMSGIVALSIDFSRHNSPTTAVEATASIDTFIPRGFALVPIEVQNYEALDSVFGNYGIVTLYTVPEGGQGQPRKLAERVKMLRAPLNPNQFGVLIKETESEALAGHIGPVFVIVHNRASDAGGVNDQKVIRRNKIHIEEESE